mmetsp:Transcript_71166/g.123470  ORF Transcript_71166/g.123470 Transcript_71166/m.123470 type:complete len:89 (-) Transcript_71166:3-269(-)
MSFRMPSTSCTSRTKAKKHGIVRQLHGMPVSGVSKENANAESLEVVAGFAKADEAQIRRSPALLCNRALENYMTIMPHATTEIRVRVA